MIVSQNVGNVGQKPNSLYIRWGVDPNLEMVHALVIVRNNKLNNILFLFVFAKWSFLTLLKEVYFTL